MPVCFFDSGGAGEAVYRVMIPGAAIPSVFDVQSLARLKADLRKDDPQALKAAARQFEAVFLQMVLKSMRAATPQEGMLDSDQTRLYQELLDAQLAQVMAAQGGTGLAAVIERQLAGRDEPVATPNPDRPGWPLVPPARAFPPAGRTRAIPLPQTAPPAGLPLDGVPARPAVTDTAVPPVPTFVATIWPHAVAASQATGIPAQFIVAHAALESGWGKSEPRTTDGRPSYNLFGIKAVSGWQGAVAEAATIEYENGVAARRVARFRAYASYADAFHDYAQLMRQSSRYAEVLGSRDPASFAQALQRAGYATDPAYAAKLERLIGSLALSGGVPAA